MNELTLRVKQNPGSIELNFDDLERQLDARLEEYRGAIFTEESRVIAKKEVASLRKLKKDIDDARKAVKTEWMRPYEAFEERMKKLAGKVDEPIGFINDQVREFEEKRKSEKKEKIKGIYRELISEANESVVAEYAPLEKIYDIKWENASVSVKIIRDAMGEKIEAVETAVNAIRAMNSDKEREALDTYKRTMDMNKALAVITEYERHKAEVLKRQEEEQRKRDERQRQAEIERARAAEREAVVREEQVRKEERERLSVESKQVKNPITDEEFSDDDLPFEQPSTITVFYKVIATPQDLENVEMAFNSIGIYFERKDA